MMIGFGRYNLLLKLGQGGMGSVYLARQKTLRRFCAVKVISPQFSSDQEAANRFLREARATASLSHPNLVHVFDCDKHENQSFIAMEYVEGMSLGEVIRRAGAIPIGLALYWLKQAATALDYIHSKNITHRDIKPDNMIADSQGVLKIMDLGLAKDHFEGDLSMTMTGTIMGSPHYISPEQINDSKTVDHRTDLYSLGISFYQMVVGHLPFQLTSAAALCVAHLQQPIPSVMTADAEQTRLLDELIAKLVEKDPKNRFQTAAELGQAIDPLIARFPMDAVAEEFFKNLRFEERAVAHIMMQEATNEVDIDADLEGREASSTASTPTITFTSSETVEETKERSLTSIVLGVGAILLLAAAAFWFFALRQPSEEKEPPAVVASEFVPKATPTSKVGGLFVRTHPEKAIVLFGSKSKTSPASFEDVPVGQYTVKVSLSGYEDLAKAVEISEGSFTELELALKHLAGTARIETVPSGAEVFVKGVSLGETPVSIEGGDGDLVDYTIKKEGYRDSKGKARLTALGTDTELELVAIRKTAAATTQGEPADASETASEEAEPDETTTPMHVHEELRRLSESMDAAHAAPESDWKKTRQQILDQFASELKSKRVLPVVIRQATTRLGSILDQVRTIPEGQYELSKKRFLQRTRKELIAKTAGE